MAEFGFWLAQGLTGLANASSLFLIACGLSIVFGVTRIVNFAHGSFFMLGAYMAVSAVVWFGGGVLGFWGAMLAAALAVAFVGLLVEVLVLRRLYCAPELFQLVATFGVLLVIQDLALALWGPSDILGPRAPGLDGVVRLLGEPIPEYDLALIVIGPALLLGLWLLFNRTRWGVLVRAAAEDRDGVGALGVNQRLLYTSAFMLGAALAGLGGALQIPREAASLQMDLAIIAEAFVVVVVGGMGSLTGAFLAAILISLANAYAVLIFPDISLILPFLVMAAVLMVRPNGLFGRPLGPHPQDIPRAPPPLMPAWAKAMTVLGVLIFSLTPVLGDAFMLTLAIDLMIAMLFAAALHFLMGLGGLVSFGHAAYFGAGAYAAALAVKHFGLGMIPAMALGPLAGAALALIVGGFCARLSGVYLAMLTLAAAQIVWGVAFQWRAVTGGDDGIVGVWPDAWASDDGVFFYLALVLCLGGVWLLRHIAHAPFGYVLRGGRDSPRRAEANGIDLARHQWLAFILAGALAGLAGVVFAFAKGSVFPDALSVGHSVDALIMVLMGGVHALAGPVWGAAAFVLIEDWVTRLDYWRAIFGAIILLIVLAAPDGIAGGVARLRRAT